VTAPAYREVSVFKYLSKLQADLLEKVFCSWYWEQVCCQEIATPDGKKMRIDLTAYPPGGKKLTAMRRCGVCGRWAPPDLPAGTCADCLTEAREEAFEEHLHAIWNRGDGDEGLVRDLVRLRGRQWCVRHMQENAEPDERAFLPDWLLDRQDDSMRSADDRVSFWRRTSGGQHWVCELLDTPEKAAPRRSPREVVGAIWRHVAWVARDSHRRALGCSTILLPEGDEALLKEITYWRTNGRVMPRAKWDGTVNPRQRYRYTGRRRRNS
jgi:hypothetical protein